MLFSETGVFGITSFTWFFVFIWLEKPKDMVFGGFSYYTEYFEVTKARNPGFWKPDPISKYFVLSLMRHISVLNLVSFHEGESPVRETVSPADRPWPVGEVLGEDEGDPLGQHHGRAAQGRLKGTPCLNYRDLHYILILGGFSVIFLGNFGKLLNGAQGVDSVNQIIALEFALHTCVFFKKYPGVYFC